jgi:hypothetical protein
VKMRDAGGILRQHVQLGVRAQRIGNKMQEAHGKAATTVPKDTLLNPMNLRRLTIAVVLVVCIAVAARDQSSPPPASELINEVVANELTDRVEHRKWMYLIDKREGKQTVTEEQVDTKDGPFYRLLAIDGTPLDPSQRQQDNARMGHLLHDPSQQLKFKQGHDEDEQKLEKLMRLMPEAFLYDYDGVEGDLVRNSAPTPTTIPRRTKPG